MIDLPSSGATLGQAGGWRDPDWTAGGRVTESGWP